MNWKYYQPTFEHRDIFPDYDGAWFGHKFFTYDLVANTKPQKIVELGTHKGTSFFSFCQAVKDFKLDAELIAIDTWKGDKHAGYYEEDVYELFNKVKNKTYPNLNTVILKKLFDDAIKDIPDNSVDILHIDGLHTYEAVKHDFENWINKVKNNGIVLFHDTHEKTADFGVYKLWEELKEKYQTMEFAHSHGLGVLFKDKNKYKDLLNLQNIWKQYYSVVPENRILKNDNSIKESAISGLSQAIQQKDSEALNLNQSIQQKESEALNLNQSIQKNEENIQVLNQSIQQKESAMFELDQSIKQKNENIQSLNQTIEKEKEEADNLKELINQKESVISELNQIIEENKYDYDVLSSEFKEKSESLDYILNRCISLKIGLFITAPLRFLYEVYKNFGGYFKNKFKSSPNKKSINFDKKNFKKIAIYVSSTGNYFFNEIASLITAGFKEYGVDVDLRSEKDGFSKNTDLHLVVAPHEFFYLGEGMRLEPTVWPKNIILFNLEQISTSWFKLVKDLFERTWAIWDLDLNSSKVHKKDLYFSEFFPLGFVKSFDLYSEVKQLPNNRATCFLDKNISQKSYYNAKWTDRPIDLLFIGSLTKRREEIFSKFAKPFSNHKCYLHLPTVNCPTIPGINTCMDTNLVIGLSQRSKILLNIHQGKDKYFEWHRIVLLGIWQKTLVITESCGKTFPFVSGKDFITANIDDIPNKIEYYLNTKKGKKEAEEIVKHAYKTLVENCNMKDVLDRLINSLSENGNSSNK